MGKFSDSIQPAHRAFLEKQRLFFVASAPLAAAGRVNLSPKGGDSFRVFSSKKVGFLDFIGSGNETSAHALENGRITFMFCAFEGPPNILRLYGRARAVLPTDGEWAELAPFFGPIPPNARQLFLAEIDLVQTSCGYSMPLFEHVGERDIMEKWAEKKGPDGLRDYILEKNLESIDGLPTDWGRASEG